MTGLESKDSTLGSLKNFSSVIWAPFSSISKRAKNAVSQELLKD